MKTMFCSMGSCGSSETRMAAFCTTFGLCAICLAAAVQLGRFIEVNWNVWKDEVSDNKLHFAEKALTTEDKRYIKENLVQKMYIIEHKSVIKQYQRSITIMASEDYPENWPSLLNDIKKTLSS